MFHKDHPKQKPQAKATKSYLKALPGQNAAKARSPTASFLNPYKQSYRTLKELRTLSDPCTAEALKLKFQGPDSSGGRLAGDGRRGKSRGRRHGGGIDSLLEDLCRFGAFLGLYIYMYVYIYICFRVSGFQGLGLGFRASKP